MDLHEAIAKRRSIRRFKPDPVPEATLTRLLEAARLAPSGTNSQPWCLLVVRSPEKRAALHEAAYGQAMFAQAPAVIAVLGDRQKFKKRLRRGKELVDLGAVDASVMETVGKVYGRRSGDPGGDDRAIATACSNRVFPPELGPVTTTSAS